jgi:hypothetical protein
MLKTAILIQLGAQVMFNTALGECSGPDEPASAGPPGQTLRPAPPRRS